MNKIKFTSICESALEDCIIDPFDGIQVYYDDESCTLEVLRDYKPIYTAKYSEKEYNSKLILLHAFVRDCVKKALKNM